MIYGAPGHAPRAGTVDVTRVSADGAEVPA